MKRILFSLILCLFCFQGFSDVTATILDVSQDSNSGAIIVKTQYKVDGVELVSNYPLLDGKYYWQTRYNLNQFAGMTDGEVKTRIFKDIKAFGENVTCKTYLKQANFVYTKDKGSLLIGQTGTILSADILVDSDGDNIVDTKWIVKTDGTRIEEVYVP